jgi:hypothetical protein
MEQSLKCQMEQMEEQMEHILNRLEIIENQLKIKTDATKVDIKPTLVKKYVCKKYVCSSCDAEFKCGDMCCIKYDDGNKYCLNCRTLINTIFLETKWPL